MPPIAGDTGTLSSAPTVQNPRPIAKQRGGEGGGGEARFNSSGAAAAFPYACPPCPAARSNNRRRDNGDELPRKPDPRGGGSYRAGGE